MKKTMLFWATALLLAVLLAACGTAEAEGSPVTKEPSSAIMETVESTNAVTEATSGETEEKFVYEGDASSYYIDVVYAEQIARYHTALTEKWDEGKYFENNMSAQPYYYYEGNPLDNVGFGFVDLDNDGYWELIIGAILNAERDPAVFEIWTQVDGEPVMLAQGGARNRYMLQYVEEDDAWYVVNEGSGSAFCHATYYLMLNEGKFEVVQGIVFDASADEQNPWFLACDLDWDVSDDEPIDEETADEILESNRKFYTALEYVPYIFFEPLM